MRRAIFLGLVFIYAFSGCWEGISRSVCATVLSVHGEVLYLEKGSANSRAVSLPSQLCPGSVLRTSADAQTHLRLIPGALAQVAANSELTINELKITKDGNETGDAIRERVARIELRRGGMVGVFEGFAQFKIKTSGVTINVLPSCLFRLDVDESTTRLTCIRGKLYVTPQSGDLVAINGGLFCEWPSKNGVAPVTQDRRAEADTTEALQVARQLQELDAAQRDRLPF